MDGGRRRKTEDGQFHHNPSLVCNDLHSFYPIQFRKKECEYTTMISSDDSPSFQRKCAFTHPLHYNAIRIGSRNAQFARIDRMEGLGGHAGMRNLIGG